MQKPADPCALETQAPSVCPTAGVVTSPTPFTRCQAHPCGFLFSFPTAVKYPMIPTKAGMLPTRLSLYSQDLVLSTQSSNRQGCRPTVPFNSSPKPTSPLGSLTPDHMSVTPIQGLCSYVFLSQQWTPMPSISRAVVWSSFPNCLAFSVTFWLSTQLLG